MTPQTRSQSTRVELRELIKLAAPIAIAQAGAAMMGIVDTLVVGRAGAVALASVGLASSVFFWFFCLGIGVMLGMDPMISQALGAKDPIRARRLYWLGNRLAVGIGLVVSLPILVVPFFLESLGIEHQLVAEARNYLWWRIPSVVPMLWFMIGRAYLQGLKRPAALVVATVVANVANYFLNVLFVFGGADQPAWTGLQGIPALGASGAAIASVLCTLLQLGIVALAVRYHRPANLPRDVIAGSPQDTRTALRVGLPVGLHMFVEVGVFSVAGILAASMGAAAAGAHQVAIMLASFTFCVAVGIGNAGSVRVGHAVGAGDTPGARRAGFVAIGTGAGFMGLCGLVLVLFPAQVVGLVSSDPEVFGVAVGLMGVAAAFQISDGVQGVGAGVLRGAGDSHFTFRANLVGHWLVGAPLALLLAWPAGMGVTGLWWGLSAGLTVVAVAVLWRFARLSRQTIRPLAEQRDPVETPTAGALGETA
ncbi:MAG: MATE family efflux transporter [Myxococcota bacterium]|nr:MATE family efflux transporter [Myxococcota bacterium]